jgi:hypothetical protein
MGSRGVADGQHPPLSWNITKGENVACAAKIPGFGNSCPVIWGDRLFVTSAVSADGNRDVRIGLYGDVDSVEDDSVYEFVLYCLNKQSGRSFGSRPVRRRSPQ